MKKERALILNKILILFTLSFSINAFWPAGEVRGYSYRKNRRHKGFKTRKREYRLEKVVRKKEKLSVKKRRPIQLQVFDRWLKKTESIITDQQISTLVQIIESTPKSQRAALYFRLAELYWQKSKQYDFEGHKYDDFRDTPEWPEKARLQQQAWANAKEYRRKAANVYYKIIKEYPNYDRLCEAYYFLGKNLFEMGQEKAALGVFREMIKKFAHTYPKCPFIPNAYLAFGEHYFNTEAIRTALKAYQQVLNYKNSSIYGFALYKIAWCYYNLVQYREALKKFVEVVQHAKRSTSNYGTHRRRIELLREALRDLVLAYSQVGDPMDAKRFFLEVGGPDYYLKMLDNLGILYRQQGKFDAVIIIYKQLMELNPESPKTLFYQLYITRAVEGMGKRERTIKEVFKLVRMVKYFRKKNLNSKVQREAEKAIAAQIKEYAKFRHYEGQKTRQMFLFQEAGEYYRAYLEIFGHNKDAYETRFWYAELLYKLRRYEEAAKQYTLCLQINPKGKFSLDAAYNAILAYHHLMKQRNMDVTVVKSKVGKNIRKRELPPLAKKFLQACERFLKYFPNTEQAVDVAYKAAQIYYFFNHFDEALKRFYFLVKKYPKHEYAMYSAHSILDVYNIQKKWDLLNKWSWKFYNDPKLGNAEFKREVKEILIQSGIKICEKIMNLQKKYLEAAKCYHKFATRFPENKRLAALALYNASLNYYKAKKPEKALEIRLQLLNRYPKSRFIKGTIRDLAKIYARRADFEKAAKFYDIFVKKYPKDPKALDAQIHSALFKEALGEESKAMAIYRKLLVNKDFRRKKPKQFVKIYMRVARRYKERGLLAYYARMMKEFDEKRYGPYPLRLFARAEYAFTKMRLRRSFRREGEAILKRVARLYDTLPKSEKKKYPQLLASVAKIRFFEAEKLFKDYVKIRIPRGAVSQKILRRILIKKEQALGKSKKAYGKVIAYRQAEWGIAAFYRAGELFLNYSKFLLSAPPPRRSEVRKEVAKNLARILSRKLRRRIPVFLVLRNPNLRAKVDEIVQQSLDKYRMRMEEKAMGPENEAIKMYIRCLKMSHNLRVYNKWTWKALARLRELRPSDFPPSLESGWFNSTGFSSVGFPFVRKLLDSSSSNTSPSPTPSPVPAKKNGVPPVAIQ